MKDTVLTIFWGRTTSIFTGEWDGNEGEWDSLKGTEYPLDTWKTILPWTRNKYIDKPLILGSPLSSKSSLDEADFYENYIFDPFNGELTKIRVRLVLYDLMHNKHTELAYKLSPLKRIDSRTKIYELQILEKDMQIEAILEALSELKNDIAIKNVLTKALEIKKLKQASISTTEFMSAMAGRQ